MPSPSQASHDYPSLQGRVVIVTGGNRGLGREMALALVAHGANVTVTSQTGGESLAETARQAEALGAGEILALQGNVADWDDCRWVMDQTLARFGAVHSLINNAGRGMRLISETFNTVSTKFWEADVAAWKEIIDVNINGTFMMARAVTPHLVSRGFGKIINISTSDITMTRQGYTPYGPSKTAIEAASAAWSVELADTGVSVNVLLPGGATDTDLLPPGPDKKGADGNLLDPAIMRAPALWLCADQSNDYTGRRLIARQWKNNIDPTQAAQGTFVSPGVLGGV
ncbi:MAG: SDR family NAD(P)-dependent oxidoreductase [Alphaproteobacteria bacterium]|nr:SDR family NAD(P)-dependent oxidoreductase [Alphaproteobacteria bacterium]